MVHLGAAAGVSGLFVIAVIIGVEFTGGIAEETTGGSALRVFELNDRG